MEEPFGSDTPPASKASILTVTCEKTVTVIVKKIIDKICFIIIGFCVYKWI